MGEPVADRREDGRMSFADAEALMVAQGKIREALALQQALKETEPQKEG